MRSVFNDRRLCVTDASTTSREIRRGVSKGGEGLRACGARRPDNFRRAQLRGKTSQGGNVETDCPKPILVATIVFSRLPRKNPPNKRSE